MVYEFVVLREMQVLLVEISRLLSPIPVHIGLLDILRSAILKSRVLASDRIRGIVDRPILRQSSLILRAGIEAILALGPETWVPFLLTEPGPGGSLLLVQLVE